jgi:hypothetical protein
MLSWGIIREQQWHQSDNPCLKVFSLINTILMFAGIVSVFACIIIGLLYGCMLGGIGGANPP